GPVVARRAAVRGGRGLLAVPAGHPAEHAARDRRRGVAAAARGGTAGAGGRGPVAEGSRRAVAGRAGGGGPAGGRGRAARGARGRRRPARGPVVGVRPAPAPAPAGTRTVRRRAGAARDGRAARGAA